jgi:hypothetical protein
MTFAPSKSQVTMVWSSHLWAYSIISLSTWLLNMFCFAKKINSQKQQKIVPWVPSPLSLKCYALIVQNTKVLHIEKKGKKNENQNLLILVKLRIPPKLVAPKEFGDWKKIGCHLMVFPCTNHTWLLNIVKWQPFFKKLPTSYVDNPRWKKISPFHKFEGHWKF